MRVGTVAIIASLVAACSAAPTTQKSWTATGGSRGDGTVELTYWEGLWENSSISVLSGIPIAAQRCKAWGYESAEPFGSSIRKCNQTNRYGCYEYVVTATYQCLTPLPTGGPLPAQATPPNAEAGIVAAPTSTSQGYAPKAKELPKNSFTAGRLARTLGCDVPALLSMSPSIETFQTDCPGGQSKIIQCEFTNCRVMQ